MADHAARSTASALAGRTAVVTGAGRGLGQAVACALAARGMQVAVVARTAEQVAATVALIRQAGGTALAAVSDISQIESMDRLRELVQAELAAVSVLINAAGVFGPIQPVAASDPRRWIETIQINTLGPYLTCRAFLPGMLAANWGRIVNFSSAAALHAPGPLNSAYGTSKVALNQFTRHLAAELSGTGVTANVIHPGEVKTAMWAAIASESQATGPVGEGYRRWAADVGASGGDPPAKAVALVLEILAADDPAPNGQFLWIHDGLQRPIASW